LGVPFNIKKLWSDKAIAINKLLPFKIMEYNQIYKTNNVWGTQPNKLLYKIYSKGENNDYFLDLGCGQGRDALFMLKNGYKVTAVDNSEKGIDKIKEYIKKNNLFKNKIDIHCDDIRNFDIEDNKYSIINFYNSLQFLPKKDALILIAKAKKLLKIKGHIIISSFLVDDPTYTKQINRNRCFFKSKELKNIFSDFTIIFYKELIIEDKAHIGYPEPHKHSVVKLIAQKISN